MRIFFVRHGDKATGAYYNKELKIHDYPLTELGILEAKALLEDFASVSIDKIYISQYLRTKQTISYLAEERGIEPIIDSRINEIDQGLVASLSHEEVALAYPEYIQWTKHFDYDYHYPEGESGQAVMERLNSFLEDMKQEQGHVVAVCHEGAMKILGCILFDYPVEKRFSMQVDTCSIIEIQYESEHNWWKLVRFNYKNGCL